MKPCTMIYDLVEENGKTIKDNNIKRQHAIPVGSLVEIIWDDDYAGVRVYVASHHRDCDGTPLYGLSMKRELEDFEHYRIHGGFSEEMLRPVE